MQKTNAGLRPSRLNLAPAADTVETHWKRVIRRRSFLQGIGMAAAGTASAAGLLAQENKRLSRGDAALLRFAATAEFIEADLWQQYNELGGAVDAHDNPNAGNPAYVAALENLDGDMPQYISDNTDDEISHRDFLNAYLVSRGAAPVDFTHFETLPPTKGRRRRPEQGAADQPAKSHRGHELVLSISQHTES